ncbi:MAG: hypothetical protein WAV72_06025 [Bradyrhizobium sp.]
MDIWDYDHKTGALLGRSAADPSPEEPGAWLIPAYATTIRPPSVPEGCVAIFNGGLSAVGEWRIELDPGQVKVLGLKEWAALFVLVNSYVGSREDYDKARVAIMGVVEEMLEGDAAPDLSPTDKKWVKDQIRALMRTLLDGKSAN